MDLRHWVGEAISSIERWEKEYGPYEVHPSLRVGDDRMGEALGRLAGRLRDNYPFFHPRYAGQMLKPPHPAAIVGYVAAMRINPNNHALDGGPATAAMEKEVVARLAAMFGYGEHLGHLTSSGTIANLEALFVARESHPGRAVAYSAESHYTHARMCGVLGVEGRRVPVDGAGRMDLDALEDLLRAGGVGTVVATAGTTGLGAVDPVHEIVALARRYGARVHVDAAYGGFFTLLAADGTPEPIDPLPWRGIAEADSVVVDPHKHGLQPYGCGAVLFRDPSVGRFYVHDSPYTYFTSDELHLGEISLECSRAGAAAAALWLTFELLPPTPEGLGRVLAAGRRAAVRWADLIESSEVLGLYQRPELDIVSFFPAAATLSEVDAASRRVMREGMDDPADPVFLSVLRVGAADLARRVPQVTADADGGRILRSVLMKPEQEAHVDALHARVEALARG
ncbi:glutamate/tyrosine decarboxylase-like PLP-dependent enzyme [Streptosporangium becharense]|uniref:Glutamate/tyrosine decarboxylase-like PLP-dependent enzyme n=1 Tax=Streptosporangium becharense TaxID=1816182 RepID=A0A7W9IC86_9ACTN|nr:aminotransferase class I/II-fold pyridoxal phosphate-dependent enzyme [Streptosporangium becharense]MBB2910886.1 glutamate/tyrosine decarboxylase-like PLP-dependent enzyme [Streptosporangium becharense]MBB5817581.1 glutamate/tyrosine decarboxylase-like PLP-dependent enzyme [Streptosporangium becharense]